MSATGCLNGTSMTLSVESFREHAPSIIFMDEIDSIGSARMESGSGNSDSEVQRTMLELLNQLDGFEASNKIKVIENFSLTGVFASRAGSPANNESRFAGPHGH